MTERFATWRSQLRERANIQFDIAIALDFNAQDAIALLLLHGGPFREAGELIDKLNDMEEARFKGDPVNLQPPEPSPPQACDPEPAPTTPESSKPEQADLLAETLALYRKSKCFRCHMNPCSVLLLPCSELTLCVDCSKVAKECPYCKVVIECTIKTFI